MIKYEARQLIGKVKEDIIMNNKMKKIYFCFGMAVMSLVLLTGRDVTKAANNLNEAVFKVGEEVKTTAFGETIFKVCEIKAQLVYNEGVIYNKYKYIVGTKNRNHTLAENQLIKINKYWFINSEGRICEVELKNDEKDVWRKMTGNFFNTKEEAIIARLKAEKYYLGEFAPQKHLFEEYGI